MCFKSIIVFYKSLLLLNIFYNYVKSEIKCPQNYNQWGINSLDLERFQGIWFEQWQTFEGRNCSFLDFTNCQNTGNGYCDLFDHTVIPGDENDDIYVGSVSFKNKKQEKGHIFLDFKENGNFDMFIVDTDYYDCAVGYLCSETGEYIWALSRDRDNTDGCLPLLNKFLTKRGINFEELTQKGGGFKRDPKFRTAELYQVNQSDCPPINNIARCPPNFKNWGIDNLNLNLFQGRWYEIWSTQTDRWKASHQFSGCNNKLGTCQVLFTHYLPQTNQFIFESGISSRKPFNWGQINITLIRDDNNKVLAQYAILYTDYKTCSVVYSCGIQLNGESPGEFIYVLSKQKSKNIELCRTKAEEVLREKGFDWKSLESLDNRKGINFYVTGSLNKTIQF